MATSTITRVTARVKLENGRDEAGVMHYTGISLGTLNKDTFNADKALAIKDLLTPCLSKNVAGLEKTEVSTIEAD